MAGLRFPDLQSRPTEFLDFTSLTLDEFQQLVPPFEAAFHARMTVWRLDGKPRTARRFTGCVPGSTRSIFNRSLRRIMSTMIHKPRAVMLLSSPPRIP